MNISSSGSAFFYLDGESEFVEFEEDSSIRINHPDSNLLSSFVLPEFSEFMIHENPFLIQWK